MVALLVLVALALGRSAIRRLHTPRATARGVAAGSTMKKSRAGDADSWSVLGCSASGGRRPRSGGFTKQMPGGGRRRLPAWRRRRHTSTWAHWAGYGRTSGRDSSITEAFVRVRYGEVPETEEELEQIRAAWRRLGG